MTEPGPFAPPSGAITPLPPAPPPPSAPVLPPPTGAPLSSTPPIPPHPRRRGWVLPVIVGGSLAFMGLAAVTIFAATQLAGAVAPSPGAPETVETELDPLIEGNPGSPLAAEPLSCVVCFLPEVSSDLGQRPAVYAEIGLPVSGGSPLELTAGEDQADQIGWWNDDGGTPEECFFTYPQAPLSFDAHTLEDPAIADDTVFYPRWHTDADETFVLTEAVRVFDQTSSAVAHMVQLEAAVAGCTHYSFPKSGWAVEVTSAPALDLPRSVASYGWAESNDFSRFYVIDLQRGNLVTRLTLSTSAGGPTEEEFRAFAEQYAQGLAARAPRGVI